jgi:pantetheine-phosphate adenylyltransferase
MKKFRRVAVGGTFDQLHKGHKALLMKAFEVGEQVVIGLCSDEFVAKMGKPHVTASYKDRMEDLRAFLKDLRLNRNAEIVSLDDPYGTAISDRSLEALIVSQETEKITLKINDVRVKAGLPLLEIIVINMVPSENCAPISTTKIRQGEIDREGRLLKRPRG